MCDLSYKITYRVSSYDKHFQIYKYSNAIFMRTLFSIFYAIYETFCSFLALFRY